MSQLVLKLFFKCSHLLSLQAQRKGCNMTIHTAKMVDTDNTYCRCTYIHTYVCIPVVPLTTIPVIYVHMNYVHLMYVCMYVHHCSTDCIPIHSMHVTWAWVVLSRCSNSLVDWMCCSLDMSNFSLHYQCTNRI